MNLLGFFELVSLSLVILLATKRAALLALMAGVLFLSQYQAVKLLGLNIYATRFLEVAMLIRVVGRNEFSSLSLNSIDRAFIALYAYTTVVYLLRSEGREWFQVGTAVDALIIYFSCRVLINSPEEFRWILRSFVLLLIPFVAIVVSESLTGGRSLGFTGWRPPGGFAYDIRHNRIRCLGSFRHSSLLGTLSVSFVPMFIGAAFRPSDRKRMALGIALCVIVIWAANSGGPISGTAFGCLAWLCWKVRTKMRSVRFGIVGIIILAAIVMKAPVWYLLARVSSISGGDGWHRSYLLDISTQNLGKWWLGGMPLSETVSWFPYTLNAFSSADITNQFILFGLTAGLGAIVLFILVLSRAFGALGTALEAVRAAHPQSSEAEFLLWGLGCMLAAHVINLFGITYFDQTSVLWFVQLAAVSSLSDKYRANPLEGDPVPSEEETESHMPYGIQPMAQ